jgi:hypothetical protein
MKFSTNLTGVWEMKAITIGTKVVANGHRFEVIEIRGSFAKCRLLGNKKDTGNPVDFNYTEEIPISSLTPLED